MNMNKATSPSSSKLKNFALFDVAFRPLFLCGGSFALIAIIIWAGLFSGHLSLNVYGGGLWWHTHEMLFGFVCAIIMGFLLTAVQNWTQQKSISHYPLLGLVLLWLSARLALLFPAALPAWLISAIDIAFLPLAAFFFIRPIIKVKLWRNLIFLPLLIVLTLTNITMHYALFTENLSIIFTSGKTAVLIIAMIMSIMGGRVIPMFTANGTGTPRVHEINWLEKSALGSLLLVVIFNCGLISIPAEANAILLFSTAILHFFRVFRWRFHVTLSTPLVWSLHVSYALIPTGLVLFGIAEISHFVSTSQAIHTITVGAMGMMILSMISRVSLGHTGRKIQVGKLMTVAFIFVFLAFIMRVFGQYFMDDYQLIITSSAILWALAYGAFVIFFSPVLIKKRNDG